ncbi:TPA: hypothetical protein QCY24_003445 [Bacillus wiedmannii]|nr:hypothetical protein [Bacillus wiedmannii]
MGNDQTNWKDRIHKYSPISYWLNKRKELPHYKFLKEAQPNIELGYFLALDICVPLHEIKNIDNEIFKEAWRKNYAYLEEAYEIVEGYEEPYITSEYFIDIDNEIAYEIEYRLGKPPAPAYPIYIVTVGTGEEEKVVYIGKTSINAKSRFNGGHSVALKLHSPKYEGLKKNVYVGSIMFLTENKEYLPLEWIYPYETSSKVLDNIESGLIYYFSPELNWQKKRMNYSNMDININVENHTRITSFLHHTQIYL